MRFWWTMLLKLRPVPAKRHLTYLSGLYCLRSVFHSKSGRNYEDGPLLTLISRFAVTDATSFRRTAHLCSCSRNHIFAKRVKRRSLTCVNFILPLLFCFSSAIYIIDSLIIHSIYGNSQSSDTLEGHMERIPVLYQPAPLLGKWQKQSWEVYYACFGCVLLRVFLEFSDLEHIHF